MIELCDGSITFPPLRDRGPDVRLASPCLFSGPVNEACSVLTGVDYGFTDEDHHVFRTTIRLTPQIIGDVVSVLAALCRAAVPAAPADSARSLIVDLG
jgi:hypothetical protein